MDSSRGVSRPSYTPAQRAWAVAVVQSGSETQKDVARQLGCCARQVRRWVRQADIDAGKRRGVKSQERRELYQLRRTVLRQQRLIHLLEEARDFFVSETR